MKKQKFVPNWFNEPTPDGTYRSLYKWGDPAGFKHPNSGLVKLIMETFGLSEEDLENTFESRPGENRRRTRD